MWRSLGWKFGSASDFPLRLDLGCFVTSSGGDVNGVFVEEDVKRNVRHLEHFGKVVLQILGKQKIVVMVLNNAGSEGDGYDGVLPGQLRLTSLVSPLIKRSPDRGISLFLSHRHTDR